MRKIQFGVLFCFICSAVSAQTLRVVNAASLATGPVAPGSIVSIFGTNLTTGVAHADSAATPPTTLNGVSVSINNAPVSLFYVSPTQINGVVSLTTPTGNDTVTVKSSTGTQTGPVTVSTSAPPGLFSLYGSGARDGAILNAVTFLLGAFSTQTQNSQTYLALFATGLNPTVTPTVTVNGVPVTVTFAGAAPCCDGLQQINIMLPASLAGAGRVPVIATSNGQVSNAVQVVLLPPSSQSEFPEDQENQSRNRELASLAYVPGTSLVLSTDENDDVVRVIDIAARKVSQVIALPDKSGPQGIAVNAAGTIAVVAEAGSGKVAIVDIVKGQLITEVATGSGSVNVAIAGSQAIAVSQDTDTAVIIDLSSNTVQKILPVGRGPEGLAVDATARKAYVANQDDGTITVIDLAGLSVSKTITLAASVRPDQIALIPGTGAALVTDPGAGPNGQVLLVNLTSGATVGNIEVNPAANGGASEVVVFNNKAYFANQSGGSVSVLPLNATTGAAAGAVTTIKVDLGPRALAVDSKDNLLVVSNEGTGTLVLVSLTSGTVVDRINAVKTGEDDHDDRSDRGNGNGQLLPAVQSILPLTGKAGTTFTLTVTGANLTGATGVEFIDPTTIHGNGNGNGDQPQSDSAFTVTNVKVATGGTQLTATVSIAASAKAGTRLVRVLTPSAASTLTLSAANTFTVTP